MSQILGFGFSVHLARTATRCSLGNVDLVKMGHRVELASQSTRRTHRLVLLCSGRPIGERQEQGDHALFAVADGAGVGKTIDIRSVGFKIQGSRVASGRKSLQSDRLCADRRLTR